MRFKPFFLSFFLIFVVDQFTKLWAQRVGESVINTGVSLSLFTHFAVYIQVLIIVSIFVVVSKMMWEIWRRSAVMYGAFCASVCSNLVDRLFFGGVRDFFDLPVVHLKNNFADLVISLCLMWVAWQIIKKNADH